MSGNFLGLNGIFDGGAGFYILVVLVIFYVIGRL